MGLKITSDCDACCLKKSSASSTTSLRIVSAREIICLLLLLFNVIVIICRNFCVQLSDINIWSIFKILYEVVLLF